MTSASIPSRRAIFMGLDSWKNGYDAGGRHIFRFSGHLTYTLLDGNQSLWRMEMSLQNRAVRNYSFRFDINISGWQAFILKPIPISIIGKLDFETIPKTTLHYELF